MIALRRTLALRPQQHVAYRTLAKIFEGPCTTRSRRWRCSEWRSIVGRFETRFERPPHPYPLAQQFEHRASPDKSIAIFANECRETEPVDALLCPPSGVLAREPQHRPTVRSEVRSPSRLTPQSGPTRRNKLHPITRSPTYNTVEQYGSYGRSPRPCSIGNRSTTDPPSCDTCSCATAITSASASPTTLAAAGIRFRSRTF